MMMVIVMVMMIRYQQGNVRQKNYVCPCSCHKDMWGNSGRAPLILNLSTGWKFNSTKKRREMEEEEEEEEEDDDDDKISTRKCTAKSVPLSLLLPQRHVRGVEVELR